MNYKQKHSWRMRGWKQKQKKHLLWSLSSAKTNLLAPSPEGVQDYRRG